MLKMINEPTQERLLAERRASDLKRSGKSVDEIIQILHDEGINDLMQGKQKKKCHHTRFGRKSLNKRTFFITRLSSRCRKNHALAKFLGVLKN
jgi:CelD/BcsL family acetyltransferase involved in cellulose biosynthesis